MGTKKIVDCFLDGHGNYGSNLVSFKKVFPTNIILSVTVSK